MRDTRLPRAASAQRYPVFGHAGPIVVLNLIIDRHAGSPGSGFAWGSKRRYLLAMKIDGKQMRTIWVESDGVSAGIIDQTQLPHRFATLRLATLEDAARAIKTMQVRGAPLIGATAAYGVWLALRADASDEALEKACTLRSSPRVRPRSISNGRSRKCWQPCVTGRGMSVRTQRCGVPARSPTRTSPSIGRSAGMG